VGLFVVFHRGREESQQFFFFSFLAVSGSEQLRVGHSLPSRSLHLASSLGEALQFKSGPLVGRVHHTQISAGGIFFRNSKAEDKR